MNTTLASAPGARFDAGSDRPAYAIVATFLIIWIALVAASGPDCHVVGRLCAAAGDRYGSWLAFHLLDGGWFNNHPNDPANPIADMPPGYAFWLAGLFAAFGRGSFLPAIAAQGIGIVVAGLFARRAVEQTLPGHGNLTLALLLLNPNVIAQAALPQTDPSFMILVMIVFTAVLHYLLAPRLWIAIVIGISIGLSAMVKVPGQYLLLLLPVALPILAALAPQASTWRKPLAHGILGAVIAAAVVAPWALHMWRSGEGVALSSRGLFALMLEDGTKYLGDNPIIFGNPGLPRQAGRGIEIETAARREAELAAQYPGYDSLPGHTRKGLRAKWMVDYYLTFPGGVPVFVRALALSWGRVLLPGGEGEWHRLLGIEQPDTSPAEFYGVKFSAVAVTLLTRVLGVAGLVALAARRRYDLLVLTVCWIALFTGLTGLVGNTRYRLPSELPLALLAAAGLVYLRAKWRERFAA